VPLAAQNTQALLGYTEAVTVTSVRNSGNVATPVDRAGVYRVSLKEAAASNGVYQAGDLKVAVATDAVAFQPKPRDTVGYGGLLYTVLDVTGSAWAKFWALMCRNLALAADLRDTGTLYRAAPAASASGLRVPHLAAVGGATAIPCRVQGEGGGPVQFADGRVMAGRYVCYVGQDVFAQVGDVWEVAGARYTVTGWRDPDRIDALMRLDLEAVDGSTT
jgi:hypothetical protein